MLGAVNVPDLPPWLRPAPKRVAALVSVLLIGWCGGLLWQGRGVATPAQRAELKDLQAGRVINRALDLLRHRYVEPARLRPRMMLEEALQAMAHLVPEMLVDVPERDPDGQPRVVRVRVGEATWKVDAVHVDTPLALAWTLLQSVRQLAERLPPDILPAKVEYVSVNGMLDTLDPYSHMLDPDQWRDMQTNTGGHFGGLGIVILAQDGVLVVQSVLADSPAQKAQILRGDEILQIDGEDTVNMSVDAAVDRLRGEVGTTARLSIRRAGWASTQEVAVVRAVIHLQSVESRLLDNGVGYARIKNFQRGTADELREAIQTMLQSGSQQAVVLDLRDNPGGLLDEAVKICDLFMTGGPAVITVTGGQRARDERLVSGAGPFRHLSLAVLINGHSASASEVVAGALKFSGRAILVGEQSYGKASVQVPYEMGEAALKLTVAKYLVPGNVDLHGVGLTPDVGIQFIHATRENVSLSGQQRTSRNGRPGHQAAAQIPPTPPYQLRVLLPDPADGGSETAAEVIERAPRVRASQLLRRSGVVQAAQTLKDAAADIAAMASEDDEALVAHLKRQGIDWRPCPTVSALALRVEITGDDPTIAVHAGEILRVSATVTNPDKAAVCRVQVITRSDDPVLDGHEQLIGRLEPGQWKTVPLSIRVSARHGSLVVPMSVLAALDGRPSGGDDQALVTVLERPAPTFAWRTSLDDSASTQPDGVLQPGEKATLHVDVLNTGAGLSQSTDVRIRVLGAPRLRLQEGRARLGQLAPGASAVARFAVEGADPKQGKAVDDWLPVTLELTVADSTLDVERTEPVGVAWGRKPLERAPLPAQLAIRKAQRAGATEWARAPVIELGRALWPPLHGDCRLQVDGQAVFDGLSPDRRFVTASVGGVKQAYQGGYGLERVPFSAPLRLDSGLNAVTIQARAGAHRIAERQLLVHCTQLSQPVPPP